MQPTDTVIEISDPACTSGALYIRITTVVCAAQSGPVFSSDHVTIQVTVNAPPQSAQDHCPAYCSYCLQNSVLLTKSVHFMLHCILVQ